MISLTSFAYIVLISIIMLSVWLNIRTIRELYFWRGSFMNLCNRSSEIVEDMANCVEDLIQDHTVDEGVINFILLTDERLKRMGYEPESHTKSSNRIMAEYISEIERMCRARKYQWVSKEDIYRAL